jgi:hypothetical protein
MALEGAESRGVAYRYPAGPLLELISRAGGMGSAVTVRPVVEASHNYLGGAETNGPVG